MESSLFFVIYVLDAIDFLPFVTDFKEILIIFNSQIVVGLGVSC